ncbi:MAG: pyridoxamine 5'-phosphate oxidase family protein [Geobacter sp.]|nr:MAG: pyridoxamine 5'-phosphate oxidase family protein [Geobacter sp.]
MRRAEKEIIDRQEQEAVIREAQVCHVALADGDQPYVVAMNFGYADGCIYLHSATAGRKLDILRRNNRVCCAFDVGHDLVRADSACSWGMRFRSVIAFGRATLLEGQEEKEAGLRVIMGQYGEGEFNFPAEATAKTAVIRVGIEEMTGKKTG